MKNHHSALPLSSCTQNAQRGETAVPGGADKSFCMLGAGHVAWHLAPALQKAGLVPRGVWSRTEAHAAQLAGRLGTNVLHTDDMATLPQADIYICCVRDDALPEVSGHMKALHFPESALYVHTAGCVALDVFSRHFKHAGVMYPLQTFSRDMAVDWQEVSVFTEASSAEAEAALQALARALTPHTAHLDSKGREALHVAAVFACNFPNHCYTLAYEILQKSGIDPRCLQALIRLTAEKTAHLSPLEGQTGPARRADKGVLQRHYSALAPDKDLQAIYKLMSQSIARYAGVTSYPFETMIDYDLKKIRALAFDVDGVLSTSKVLLSPHSTDGPLRTANTKDGYALQLAVKCGLKMAIITGGRSRAVKERYVALGIQSVFDGIAVKIETLRNWMQAENLAPEEVIYMGDDIPDYEVMQAVGCPCCPADAAPEIKSIARYVSPLSGGEGCVRDVVEQVLRAQGKWMAGAEAFGW